MEETQERIPESLIKSWDETENVQKKDIKEHTNEQQVIQEKIEKEEADMDNIVGG